METQQAAGTAADTGPAIGDVVEYVDQHGKERAALVTANWGRNPTGALNLVLVSDDDARQDSYGRQVERETSVVHESNQQAPGRFWRTRRAGL